MAAGNWTFPDGARTRLTANVVSCPQRRHGSLLDRSGAQAREENGSSI